MAASAAVVAAVAALLRAVEDSEVNPGVLGFVVVALLGVATWLLIRSMQRRLKKVDFEERDVQQPPAGPNAADGPAGPADPP